MVRFLIFFIFIIPYSQSFSENIKITDFQKEINTADSLFLQLKHADAIVILKRLSKESSFNKNDKAILNYKIGDNFSELQAFDLADFFYSLALTQADSSNMDLIINATIKKNTLPKYALQLDKNFKQLDILTNHKAFYQSSFLTKANVYYYWLSTATVLKDKIESEKYNRMLSAVIDSACENKINDKLEKAYFFSFYTKLSTTEIITSKDSLKALQYLNKAALLYENKFAYYYKLYNIAKGFYEWKKPLYNVENAQSYFKKNIQIVPSEIFEYSAAHYMLGKLYYLQDSTALSIYHLTQAEKSTKNILEPLSYNYQIINWLAKAYSKNGDSLIALRYYIKSEKMFQRINETYNISALNTYKYIRDEEIKQQKQNQYNKEKKLYIIIISSFLVVLCLSFFTLYNFKKLNNKLANKKNDLENSLAQNELLSREMHHRVKNNLQMISSLLSLQSKNVLNEDASIALIEAKNRIQSVSILHQGFYQDTQDHSGKVNLKEYILKLSKHIEYIFKKDQKKVSIDVSVPENLILNLSTAVPLGLILNELITNSFKYAFNENIGNNNFFIEISVLGNENDNYVLKYKDSGGGIVNQDKKEGFGTILIDLLILQLGAKLIFSNENGIRYTIHFKNK